MYRFLHKHLDLWDIQRLINNETHRPRKRNQPENCAREISASEKSRVVCKNAASTGQHCVSARNYSKKHMKYFHIQANFFIVNWT